jgi:hypothetical protein
MHIRKFIIIFATLPLLGCKQGSESSGHDHHSHSRFLQKPHQHKKTSKMRSHYDVKIESINTGDSELGLRLSVTTGENIPITHVEWKLPEGSQLISGELQSSFSQPENQSIREEIFIQTSSLKEGDQIFAFVYHLQGKNRVGVSKSFVYPPLDSTTDEKTMEKSSQPETRFLE